MKDCQNTINNPGLNREERISSLRQAHSEKKNNGHNGSPKGFGEINNHIHTIYSFSPYTPAMAALMARNCGLEAAGSVDHDSIGAAQEMIEACAVLGIGGCAGFEVRVSFKAGADGKPGPFAKRKINNPDSQGLAYMTVQGIPKSEISAASQFLIPVREERLKRTRIMTFAANDRLREDGFPQIDFQRDILEKSKFAEGGGITERHLMAAAAEKIIQKLGKGPQLTEGLKQKMGITAPPNICAMLSDPANPHYLYDLLGVLKTDFLASVFIQPNENECIEARKVTAFADSIAAIPSYAYLGDVGESPTGDKKAEKFEDDYIEELFAEISRLGYRAVTYMPPRNTPLQLENLRRLSREWGFMEISGVDINTSRQSFNCPQVLKEEFRHLVDTTWALIAHERIAGTDKQLGLFSKENPLVSLPLAERIAAYAVFGKKLDLYHPDDSAAIIAAEIKKGNF